MKYHYKCCKEFENGQTKSAMRIIIRIMMMMMIMMLIKSMWATRMMIMMTAHRSAQHIKDCQEHSAS
jgi:hypothetical protein